jgi:acyl carrier protein
MNFDAVKKVIVDVVNCDEDSVTLDASLADDLDVDSLAAVEINMALEDELGVTIPDEELQNFKTVKDIVDYLDKNA